MKFLSLARTASRQLKFQARRSAHGSHAEVNLGPPITWNYSPVPCQPYKNVYNELQTKFNTYLAISATMFVAAFSLLVVYYRCILCGMSFSPFMALYEDVFAMAAIVPPDSWRNGEPVLVKE